MSDGAKFRRTSISDDAYGLEDDPDALFVAFAPTARNGVDAVIAAKADVVKADLTAASCEEIPFPSSPPRANPKA